MGTFLVHKNKGGSLHMLNKIIQGDCLEVMKNIPDKSVDLVVTDPPYLMGYQSGWRKQKFEKIIGDRMGEKENEELIIETVKQCERVMKDDTAIYMFCSWHNVDFFKKEFQKQFKLKNIIVWVKNNHGSGDLKGSYAPKHELILFGHKGRSLNRGKRMADVVLFDKVSGGKMLHPTEKPIDLLETIINNSSDKENVVLDMFAGSGTTAVACLNTNRNFIGIEQEQKYVDIANERIEETLNVIGS